MATKEKSKKPEITKRGEKKVDPESGSPVTIGGGGGIIDTIAFIEFNPKDWDCDCYEGKLTLKGKGVISFAELTKRGKSSTHTEVSKIEIVFA